MNNLSILTLKVLRKAYAFMFNIKPASMPLFEHDSEKYSKLIIELINNDEPCMITRFGSTELIFLINYLSIQNGDTSIMKYIKGETFDWWWNKNIMFQMQNWSGFFPPTQEKLSLFAEQFMTDISQIDVLGSWVSEEKCIDKMLIGVKKMPLINLEPYMSAEPWSSALKGKKVLVIHPFAKLFEQQYHKRTLLFENPNVLPQFELKTITAVQSLGGVSKFQDWFDALSWMKAEIDKHEYDVCLIGCGAYGFSLAAHVKRSGKKAIHLGGALQLLFGVKGKRWEEQAYAIRWGLDKNCYLDLMNEFWVRPDEALRPQNAKDVEGACYW